MNGVKTQRQNIHSLTNYVPEHLMNISSGNVCNANCTAVCIALNQTAERDKKTVCFTYYHEHTLPTVHCISNFIK